MLTLVKNLIVLITTLLILLSCNNEKSIQQFIVKNQENTEIISFDLSSDVVSLKENSLSEENKAILNSVKKANVLALKLDSTTKNKYHADIEKLTNILKTDKYNELIRMGKGKNGIRIYSVGKQEKLNELIFFGNDHKKGWVLVRVLGDDMQPDKLLGLMDNIKMKDTTVLKNVINIFDNEEFGVQNSIEN